MQTSGSFVSVLSHILGILEQGSFAHRDGGRGVLGIHYHKGVKSKWLLSQPVGYKQLGVHSHWAPVERNCCLLFTLAITRQHDCELDGRRSDHCSHEWPNFTDNCKMSEDSPIICPSFKCFLDTLETMAILN